jgi:hypothetical protein
MVEKAGFIMTAGTGNKVVGRRLPGIYVHIHIMAEIAEGWSFGEFVHSPSQNNQDEKTDAEEQGDPLLVFLRPPIGLLPKGDPEVGNILE